ncbi:MAG: multifunctional CCA tRNA nucleotidyl transferase/2'3'-cyclic phosphodiesterase/2'nucleotidase/phosphatase [Gammaproteobacteria bacterium]|nr:multifunctional CCA tRNA nucleotidyl transferase/2'3'-cyclic phosphodiesterase/2'nucleotidase/phosphatase [Gammaproteobacteria bacterium]
MKVYLVGGAVRDQLLGLPVSEKDWVVVGASVDEMLKKGYRQVGKDFPVFLHPKTNDEYALARVERKVGLGYTGFDFDASPKVTLEEDLLRRDLTINAIAQSEDGTLIDPYHGKEDLDKKILRHVSLAFAEDPVRILRIARFAARYKNLSFHVADETLILMRQMVNMGEVNALVAERVWKEWERALQEKNPEEFFFVLESCNALSVLLPNFDVSGVGIKALSRAASLSADADVRFAVSLFTFNLDQAKIICERYRVPNNYSELLMLLIKHYQDYQSAKKLSAIHLLEVLKAVDVFRREARFKKFLFACEIIAETLSELNNSEWLNQVYLAAKNIDMKAITAKNLQGNDIADLIKQTRLAAIENLIDDV